MSTFTQVTTRETKVSFLKALEPFALCFTAFIGVAAMVQIVLPLA